MRVLLLIPTHTYKAADFMAAASRLGVTVVVATDRHQALERTVPGTAVAVDFARPDRAVDRLAALHEAGPVDGVVAADDESVELAAIVARRLGLRANDPEAVRATRNKALARQRFRAAGLRTPRWIELAADEDPYEARSRVRYPCVLKPPYLNASRGVVRADDPEAFVVAFDRIRRLLARPDVEQLRGNAARSILVEDYLPGSEVSVEAVLEGGRLHALAVFDKPDTPDGPTFEETLFVTPTVLSDVVRDRVVDEVRRGCAALDLREGPVHAELRVRGGVPWLLEIAARTIGGLCARALRFGAGISLEEIVLRHATGMSIGGIAREPDASGVIMLPVPAAGTLLGVDGIDEARAIRGVVDVRITVEPGARLEPAPEGNRYLGFVFARGTRPTEVADALRTAASTLRPRIGDTAHFSD